jgi:chromosome segregation protein
VLFRSNRLSDLERRQAELTQRQEQLVGRREALEAELATLSAGREEAQENLDALREQLEGVDHQLAELSRARQERQQGLSALRQAEHAATRRQAELSAQADAQASALSSYDWAQAGVRTLLAEAAKGSLGVEVLGVAAERLAVEPGREALVEAALGADLQAVLVKDGQALKQLAALAAARPDLGRVRALALDELTRPGSPLAPPAGGRPLAEVVRPEPGFEALAGLWAGAGWAETVEEALELAGSLVPGQVLVTAQGERLDRPGAATVGRVNTVSVLSRRNDLKRLQDEAAQAQEALAQAREERQAAEEHLADLEAEHQSLRGARQEQERVLRAAEQALFRAREAQGVKERQLEGLDFDANQIWSELTHVENQLGELAAKAEELAGRTPGLEEALSLAQQGLAEARLALEEARRAEGEVRLAAASAQAKAEQAARESKRLTQEMEAARERLLALSADLQSSRDAIASLTRRRQEQQDQLGGLYAEMDRQEESYRQARELHSQAQMRAGDLEASLKQARTELRKVEAESQELSLRIRELGMQRESLCDQVMERCRVDLTTDHQAHLPEGAFDPELSRQKLAKLRQRLNNLGAVNMEAITEFEALRERHEFLMGQRADLEASLEDLRQAIRKINKTSRGLFLQTLEEVNERLTAVFPDRKSTRLNSSHRYISRMPSSA